MTDLLVRLPNWVGDVCMVLPALDALRKAGCTLTCFGRGWAPSLLRAYPAHTVTLPRQSSAATKILKSHSAKPYLLFPNSLSTAIAGRRAKKETIGYAGDWRRILLSHCIKRGSGEHEVERFWWLSCAAGERLGLDPKSWQCDIPRPHLPLDEESRSEAAHLLQPSTHSQGRLIICSPLAVGTIDGQPKMWSGFRELSSRLLADGHRIIACPGPGEAASCREALDPDCEVFENVDLPTYGALCQKADLTIANDSGPLHLADASGGTALGIYGVSNPKRYRAWGASSIGTGNGWPSLEEVHERVRSLLTSSETHDVSES